LELNTEIGRLDLREVKSVFYDSREEVTKIEYFDGDVITVTSPHFNEIAQQFDAVKVYYD
jgi:hypothetical protein